MTTSTQGELDRIRAEAVGALQAGDARRARERFERLLAAGAADVASCVGLAMACARLGDRPATVAAVDRALALEPRNLHALILKGDLLAADGQLRAAGQFYGVVEALAEQLGELPRALAGEVQRAIQARRNINAQIEEHLRAALRAAGHVASSASRRFDASVDLLTGRRRIYQQQPRGYYFPELPQIEFYERESFGWLAALEAATDDIARELDGLLADGASFEPYLKRSAQGPPREGARLVDSLDWSAWHLLRDGVVQAEARARFPKTLAALEHAPLARIPGRGPMALFSVLRPGAHIEPHTGFVNARLICHLPLIVPGGCALRVGNEQRTWERGRTLVFDDTIEHEAWNRGSEPRIVLIFDVWRPELSVAERALVATLMQAVDSFEGPGATWHV